MVAGSSYRRRMAGCRRIYIAASMLARGRGWAMIRRRTAIAATISGCCGTVRPALALLPQLLAGATQRDFLAFEIAQYPLDVGRGAILAPITHGAVGKLQFAGGA